MASNECVKVTNSNKLTDENIETIIGCWADRKNKKHVAKLVTIDDVAELPTTPNAGQVAKEIAYNESYTLKDGDHFQTLKVHPGGTLFVEPGEMYIGNIQLESGSKVLFINPGMQTILHLHGGVIWRARTLNDDLEKVAKGFKLIQHGSETMTVEGMWAGTIFAPEADLVLGQSSKKLYGRFLGKNVTIHQYTQVYGIPFAPEMNTAIARRK